MRSMPWFRFLDRFFDKAAYDPETEIPTGSVYPSNFGVPETQLDERSLLASRRQEGPEMNIRRQLIGDESVRTCVYKDHLGFDTIGIGRLVDSRKPGSGLRPDEIEYLFNNDLRDRIAQLNKRLPWFNKLDEARQGVLLNMSFQLGVEGLMGFRNTLRFIEQGNYEQAAVNMRVSKWYGQTPTRAERLIKQMRTGEWQFARGT